MTRNYFQKVNLSLKDKIFAFDFTLCFLILLLGIISLFAMYSSERGAFSYHTQSHLYRFSVFFLLFIIIKCNRSSSRDEGSNYFMLWSLLDYAPYHVFISHPLLLSFIEIKCTNEFFLWLAFLIWHSCFHKIHLTYRRILYSFNIAEFRITSDPQWAWYNIIAL